MQLWRDSLWNLLGHLRSEATGEKTFEGRIEHYDVGDLRICRLLARPHRVVRTPEKRYDNQDLLKVAVQLKGASYFEQNNRGALLTPGTWSIYDTTKPYTVSSLGDIELLTLLIPRARIATPKPKLDDLLVRRFPGNVGVGKLAFQVMTTAFAEMANVSPEQEWEIVGAISQLIRSAMLEAAGVHTELSAREKWRERTKGYIEEHLREPGLSLDQVAAALNCSKRYIHKIFESEGTTASEYIWNLRLERCREQLSDPACAGKTITEIAYAWGFSNSAHFSRVFKESFHVPPRIFRASGLADGQREWPMLKGETETGATKQAASPLGKELQWLKATGLTG